MSQLGTEIRKANRNMVMKARHLLKQKPAMAAWNIAVAALVVFVSGLVRLAQPGTDTHTLFYIQHDPTWINSVISEARAAWIGIFV